MSVHIDHCFSLAQSIPDINISPSPISPSPKLSNYTIGQECGLLVTPFSTCLACRTGGGADTNLLESVLAGIRPVAVGEAAEISWRESRMVEISGAGEPERSGD